MQQGHIGGVLALTVAPDGRTFATGGGDNTIRVWNLEHRRLMATLIPVPADPAVGDYGDWLAVTPDGYYDGSAGAERHVMWRIHGNLFPVEAFAKMLHRPRVLQRALESASPLAQASGGSGSGAARVTTNPGASSLGGTHHAGTSGNKLQNPSGEPPTATIPAPSPTPDQPPQPAFAAGDSVPPEITFDAPHEGDAVKADRLSIQLTVTASSKVSEVEVLANGRPLAAKPIAIDAKPIAIDAKPIAIDAKPIPSAHKVQQQFQIDVTLPPGEAGVTLTAHAVDADGLQAREDLHLTHNVNGGALGNLYVLAVGVSRYQNPKYNLKYATPDANAFADLWLGQQGALYQKVEVTRLTDDQATSANIRAALLKLLEVSTARDSVAIFLSGHGIQAGDTGYYFAAYDVDATSLARVSQTGLPWTALQTTLSALKARRVIMFLDACHSGNALGGQQTSNERMAELLAKQAGVMVFASSRGSEYSYELDDLKHGAFTAALIEGIGQGKADFNIGGQRTGAITAEELLAYLRARVPQMTQNMQTPTCPLLRDFGEASPLAITKGP
jgi:hypothetical protein